MSQAAFLDALVADLEKVRSPMPWRRAVLVWLSVSWAIVGTAILVNGPLREGILTEILGSPRYALELALGIAACASAIWAGLELGVPGAPSASRLWTPPLLLFIAWTLALGYGLIDPSRPPTMDGKRLLCFQETLLVSLPPYSLALYLLRGRIMFAPTGTGLLVGAAAAAMPALWMHLACMAEPSHVLKSHLSPVLIVALLGAIVARRILRPL